MNIHTESVQLFETFHGVYEEDDCPTSLDGLDGSGQQIGGHGLKVLEDTHAIGVAKNFVGLMIVTVSYVCGGYKHFKWVLLIYLHLSSFNFFVQLFHFLFSVAGESKLFLVTP